MLRVQFNRDDAGVPARVSRDANTRMDAAQEWIRKALTYLDTELPALNCVIKAEGPDSLQERKRRVVRDWALHPLFSSSSIMS